MRKVIVLMAALLLALPGFGQRLIIGEKAPDFRASEWLNNHTPAGKKNILIEFFHSPSEPSLRRLPELDALARRYPQMEVIVVSREPKEKLAPLFESGNYAFFIAIDEGGRTFTNYGIQFIPFSVLLDSRGRVLWFGNSSQLTDDIINQLLK